MKKKNKVCYNTLVKQLENMDVQICQLKEQIKQLKSCFISSAISDICLDALIDVKPKGDA